VARRKRDAEDLSVEELRQLLIEKRREARQERLDAFRRSGRVVQVAPHPAALQKADEPDDYSAGMGELPERLAREKKRIERHRTFDRILLLIEIAAIAGLAFVILSGLNLIQDLNHQVASALVQPTLTPTPIISAVILPSGHTPPGGPGGAQPNNAEIPANLRPILQSLADLPIPTPGPEQAIRIQIPAIQVDAPIVQGDGWEQLKKGVGQHVGTPDPGQAGNLVLSAHNDVFGEIFRDLDRLKPGDTITIFTNQRQFVYVVSGSKVVAPTEVDVMSPTEKPTVTLISCYPYMVDDKRIAVTAQLQPNS
jgi:sortase A